MYLNTIHFSTPIGEMLACTMPEGICLVEFTDYLLLSQELAKLKKRLQAEIITDSHPYLEQLVVQMNEYFIGQRQQFDLPLSTPGTQFQQQVWQALATIPYGTTRSYSQQAQLLNNPTAVRAVARANSMNRIAIILPCHRVLGADGSLTGYSGGLERKKWLLTLEKKYC